MSLIILSVGVTTFYYLFYVPINFTKYSVNYIIQSVLNIGKLQIYQEPSRIQASLSGSINYYTQWLIVILNVIGLLFLGIKILTKELTIDNLKKDFILSTFLLNLAILGVFSFTSRYGSVSLT